MDEPEPREPRPPCAGLNDIDKHEGVYAFIGKPCEVSAVGELRPRDPRLNQKIGLVLTFFCATRRLGWINVKAKATHV